MGRLQTLFREELASLTPRHAAVARNYEIWYHLNDLAAGILFVVGSVLFFWDSTTYAATWLFLIGSVAFCVRPGIRVMRDLSLARLPAPSTGRGRPNAANVGSPPID